MSASESTTALESEVRSYSRSWPTTFESAVGATVTADDGTTYLDFFAGAGALNYGHNDPRLKQAVIDHFLADRLVHSLDMFTTTRVDFLRTFKSLILEPRGLDYKVMFPGPAGTTATEAALKLARKLTGRTNIVHFTDSFHGMTVGALAVTGSAKKRGGAGVPLSNATVLPYDGYLGDGVDTLDYFERLLADASSGVDRPAGVIVESVQGEGGINVAGLDWLRRLSAICEREGIPLILDDVQMGCGRTGAFFSFEDAGIVPDIVVLSKSISGIGLPMALTLFKREHDVWAPAEHNGTFRGIGPAFASAAETLRLFWSDDTFERATRAKGELADERFRAIVDAYPEAGLSTRGRGLARGLVFPDGAQATAVTTKAFERGLIVETAGAFDEVVKLLPPLTVTDDELERGLAIIAEATAEVLAEAHA
ncbi:diaminobutyrate--2-oxoglutarate transaminase [Pseudoclavibacter chungangensis]|uniref:Diaminobutyrate--2-oxoglutarate transaminase n=1 Tax=Pseudoclavibacter chungangensis TaxID=587635 RepID=A0A7J5C0F7_9MICO|nr:diaminobutyrate--2-oxoglutarate transaminase [Pseudoclavibacter chungangensis]KAB1660384.1 diaminobutyrate--2-oxoglutarate transaminase [Pseudoclavibacter chungangensis]NYJ65748.1 diaminobutyrate-2-oxoglutarate transaminase [Pseudoclavibacter chungangensis]